MRISDWSSDVCSSDLRCDRADYQEWPRHHGGRGGSGDELMATNGDLTDEDRLPWLETVDEEYEAGPSVLRIAALVILGLALIAGVVRSEEHTSELQSLMRISYAVFCLKKKKHKSKYVRTTHIHKTQTCL